MALWHYIAALHGFRVPEDWIPDMKMNLPKSTVRTDGTGSPPIQNELLASPIANHPANKAPPLMPGLREALWPNGRPPDDDACHRARQAAAVQLTFLNLKGRLFNAWLGLKNHNLNASLFAFEQGLTIFDFRCEKYEGSHNGPFLSVRVPRALQYGDICRITDFAHPDFDALTSELLHWLPKEPATPEPTLHGLSASSLRRQLFNAWLFLIDDPQYTFDGGGASFTCTKYHSEGGLCFAVTNVQSGVGGERLFKVTDFAQPDFDALAKRLLGQLATS